jgi:hypothetical protein
LTTQVQFFAVGTSGTDFAISSVTDTHTFNLPTASATNRGALSSADWSTFNGKQNALTNPVTGTGSAGQIAYWTGTNSQVGSSFLVWDNSTGRLRVNSTISNSNLTVSGSDNTYIFTVLSGANSRLHLGTVTSPNNDVYIRSQNNFNLKLGTNATNYLSIFNSGNVFIGTSESDAGFKLDVNGTGRFINGVNMATTSGNVGIGTASPSAKLDLGGFSGAVDGTKGIRLTNNAGTIVALEIGNIGDSYIGTNSGSDFSIRSNSTSVITVTSNLNVGIGTGSPAGKLEINGLTFVNNTGDSTARLLLRNSTTGANAGGLDIKQIGVDASINNASNGNLSILTNNTERINFTVDGYARLSINSNGVQFNGDTAAANALDDYEEGTWTPTITGGYTGITYAFQNGWYRKIGSAVIVSGRVNFSGTANGAGITMACPFTQGPTGYGSGGIPYSDIAVITNTHPYITGGSSSVLFYTTGTGAQIASSANVVDKWLSFVITMSV